VVQDGVVYFEQLAAASAEFYFQQGRGEKDE
jgi:hypothetical protein